MTTAHSPYARVLFVGSDLAQGSFAEVFQARLTSLRGAEALADVVDTAEGYEGLWQQVARSPRPLLVVDMEPQSSSPHIDWLRDALAKLDQPENIFVACAVGRAEALPVEAACALVDQPEFHLSCLGAKPIPGSHAWSTIPPHQHRVLLCNGPRCSRRGAVGLGKTLRAKLKEAGKLECEDGVHITRTQCQFPCDQGPTLTVYPSGDWYRVRNDEEMIRLVDELFVACRDVPDLKIHNG